jgi:hypothetical protein
VKSPHLLICAALLLAGEIRGEDKASTDLAGTIVVEGISSSGEVVGDAVSSYALHPVDGKVSVVVKNGEVHRVETFTSWSALNGVRGQVWERLYVSGGAYTGWTERLIQTPDHIFFSRNVIDGEIEQEIEPDGSGFIGWTVTGGDNEIESADDSGDDGGDSGADLPTVEILEEGEFDGISARRVEIDTHDNDHPTFKFRDAGYERVSFTDAAGDHELTVNQRLELEGRGEGDLSYDPATRKRDTTSTSATPTGPATILNNGGTDGLGDTGDDTSF